MPNRLAKDGWVHAYLRPGSDGNFELLDRHVDKPSIGQGRLKFVGNAEVAAKLLESFSGQVEEGLYRIAFWGAAVVAIRHSTKLLDFNPAPWLEVSVVTKVRSPGFSRVGLTKTYCKAWPNTLSGFLSRGAICRRCT